MATALFWVIMRLVVVSGKKLPFFFLVSATSHVETWLSQQLRNYPTCCIIIQKSTVLGYFVAEAQNHATFEMLVTTHLYQST
jgi:hypothetical protein